jgi:hypothetical protein
MTASPFLILSLIWFTVRRIFMVDPFAQGGPGAKNDLWKWFEGRADASYKNSKNKIIKQQNLSQPTFPRTRLLIILHGPIKHSFGS